MFTFDEQDLQKSIVGVGDGPASFNAELTEQGGSIISVDPVYAFDSEQIRQRIVEIFDDILIRYKDLGQTSHWLSKLFFC